MLTKRTQKKNEKGMVRMLRKKKKRRLSNIWGGENKHVSLNRLNKDW